MNLRKWCIVQDHTVRAIEFAPLTSSNLGRLQAEEAKEQETPQGSPPHSPLRMARQTLALIDKVRLSMLHLIPHPSIC